jgi:hypothetical protein
MRTIVIAVPALLIAGMAVAQGDGRRDALDSRAKAPPVEFRSVFEGYRPYAEPAVRDWRRSNEEVGAAGGPAARRPAQDSSSQTSKPPPGNSAPHGHGEHK